MAKLDNEHFTILGIEPIDIGVNDYAAIVVILQTLEIENPGLMRFLMTWLSWTVANQHWSIDFRSWNQEKLDLLYQGRDQLQKVIDDITLRIAD
jgi:hypothetical protein